MKQKLLFLFLLISFVSSSQSLIQSVNSGSIIATNSMVSIGEIVVVPVNQSQSSSGIIGILAQVNAQTLEVSKFDVSENITVYPNPTVSKIFFESKVDLQYQKISVFDNSGKIVLQNQINNDNSLDLTSLSAGVYLIQFSDKNLKSFKIIKH